MTKVTRLSGQLFFTVEADTHSIHCTADSLSNLESGRLRVGDDILALDYVQNTPPRTPCCS